MKMFSLALTALVVVAFTGTANAGPEKTTILHCGCVWDGEVASMAYEELSISKNGGGHAGHVVDSTDACYAGQDELDEAIYIDFVRTGADCQIAGPELRDPIDACPEEDGPEAGDSCGEPVVE